MFFSSVAEKFLSADTDFFTDQAGAPSFFEASSKEEYFKSVSFNKILNCQTNAPRIFIGSSFFTHCSSSPLIAKTAFLFKRASMALKLFEYVSKGTTASMSFLVKISPFLYEANFEISELALCGSSPILSARYTDSAYPILSPTDFDFSNIQFINLFLSKFLNSSVFPFF